MTADEDLPKRLIAGLGARVVHDDEGTAVLALSELGTTLTMHGGSPVEGVPPSLQIYTMLGTARRPESPGVREICEAFNISGGLSRWVCDPDTGVLQMSASLLLVDDRNEYLLGLADFLVRSQASEARAKLFAGACDLADATPALLTDSAGSYLWDGEDFGFAGFVEDEVLPFARPDLWPALRARGSRILPIPPYGAYQGPGWLGLATDQGWRVQIPWTSVARDYGTIEIRLDKMLGYSQGETVDLEINYNASSPMWGSGLRFSTDVPHPPGAAAPDIAQWLNAANAVPTWTHGLGRFIAIEDQVIFDVFLPAVLARDAPFGHWLTYEVLRCVAVTMQEVRPQLWHGEPVPNEQLATSVTPKALP